MTGSLTGAAVRRIELLLGIIVVLLIFQLQGQRRTDRDIEPEDRPWVGYALSKSSQTYERWTVRFASYSECIELMSLEIEHKLPPGHWLRGANFGNWYTEPRCRREGGSPTWSWVMNTLVGAPKL